MPWYLAFLLPIVERFGKIALEYGLQYLETKFPQSKPIFDLIINWLKQQAAAGNTQATQQLHAHVEKMCSGVACPPDLVKE